MEPPGQWPIPANTQPKAPSVPASGAQLCSQCVGEYAFYGGASPENAISTFQMDVYGPLALPLCWDHIVGNRT